jgi:hypothetical protein
MPFARFVAAVYACGEGSVLTRHAAAAGWEFRPEPIGPLDVTIVGDRRVRIDGIRTHRTASFAVGDLRTLHGIPATSPPARCLTSQAT